MNSLSYITLYVLSIFRHSILSCSALECNHVPLNGDVLNNFLATCCIRAAPSSVHGNFRLLFYLAADTEDQ